MNISKSIVPCMYAAVQYENILLNSISHKSLAWSLVCSSNVDIDSSVCSRADVLTESFIRLASMYHLLYSELNFQKTALINLLIVVLKSFFVKSNVLHLC